MRILYATDGSKPAREGERLIASLFARTGSHIHAFTVRPEVVYDYAMPDASLDLTRLDVVLNADQVAIEAAEHLSDEGFSVSSSSARGNPAREILRKVEDGKYDIVVLGASHTTWMGNLLLGSVSMHVLHNAQCSVIVTHAGPTGSGKILVGVDGSPGSGNALLTATKLLDGSLCAFTVATVVSQPWLSVAVYPPGPPFGGFAEYHAHEQEMLQEGWHLVERVSSSLRDEGFKVEETVLLGHPGPQLLKEADNIGADLVVVGSRGLGPIRRNLLGSVSDQVVRHAAATLVGRNVIKGRHA